MADFTPANEDAYATIVETLRLYGLESLAPAIRGYVENGYQSAQINLLIQETPEYKQRFAANTARRAKNLPVLSPAEYLATERAYREVMSSAGLPVGFYDQPSDFTDWLGNDVSPTEVQGRVQVASDLINTLDSGVLDVFHQWYSDGDLVAYALDRDRAVPVIERQYRAAQVGGFGKDAGLNISQQTAEEIGAAGVSDTQARSGVAQAATVAKSVGTLADVYGGAYTADDAAKDVLLGDVNAANTRKRLASQERGTFGGASGVNKNSLSARKPGQV